jgi:hypothetical protein
MVALMKNNLVKSEIRKRLRLAKESGKDVEICGHMVWYSKNVKDFRVVSDDVIQYFYMTDAVDWLYRNPKEM